MPEVSAGDPGSVAVSRGRRQARDERRRGVQVTLTARDQALLRALARFRIARSADLGRLFFPGRNRDVAAQRLRRLYDATYLNLSVEDRAAPNVYWLGEGGREWLRSAGGVVTSVPRGSWVHHLGIVSIWTRLASAAHRGAFRLFRFKPDWEIREGALAANLPIVPDAVVEVGSLGDGRPSRALALEVDRGTEGLACLRQKLVAYTSVPAVSLPDPLVLKPEVLIVLVDEGVCRQRQIEQLAKSVPGERVLVTTEEGCADTISTFLTPITVSRCGNGSGPAGSGDANVSSAVTGGGPSDGS